jgi:hypothetical protein
MFQNLFTSLISFFSVKNTTRILLIFVVGFFGRIIIVNLYGIDVFYDYTSLCSVLYYIHMSIFSVSLSEFFATLSGIHISNLLKSLKNVIVSVCDKYHMTLGGSPVDTKPYKEIKSIDKKYIHACEGSSSNVGGNGNYNNSNNLGEPSGSKGKSRVIESGMVPIDPDIAKIDEITKDLEYKDSIIRDKKINNSDKLKRLQMSDSSDPGKSDSSGDAVRVKEIEHVLYLKRKALESDMDPKVKLEIIDSLSDKTSKIYAEKAKSKIPVTNLEQNPMISSQSESDLNRVFGGRVRSNTAVDLTTGSENIFASPPRPAAPFTSPSRAPHGEMPTVREASELPSVIMDMEPGTPSRSVNVADRTSPSRFVNQDNAPLSDEDNSERESSVRHRLKNLFRKRK